MSPPLTIPQEDLLLLQQSPNQGPSDGPSPPQQQGGAEHALNPSPNQAPLNPGGNGQHHPSSAPPTGGKARLQCHACSRLLEYDAGAQYVQCFSCSTMNAVQPNTQIGGRVLSMLCSICHTTNLAPYGIYYVRCGFCQTISQVSHAYRQDGLPQGALPQQSSEGADERQQLLEPQQPGQPPSHQNPSHTSNDDDHRPNLLHQQQLEGVVNEGQTQEEEQRGQ